ncbi:MAG: orotidine 5''-phosphate decarboxylase, subfamily 2 [Ignavibacteria bacterium]|nr:orotidine 5''-phosphate decarboxylase, subfamily 2 [Ignavibacteria bacterium]
MNETYQKLKEIQSQKQSIICVGLDTSESKLPHHLQSATDGILHFNREIIEATHDLACAYKINFAFYEQLGADGFNILKKTFEMLPKDAVSIADAKRGDIGNTSESYAFSVFEYFGADSITVNPYMGSDSVAPFLKFNDKMVFLLALTSNPGSADFQRLESGGKPVYQHVIEKSKLWGSGVGNYKIPDPSPQSPVPSPQIGYVVGATHPEELREVRTIAPSSYFLIPGIGAQGGDIAATMKANDGKPAIINVSRGIIYASNGKDFAEKARKQAEYYRDACKE